jgi:hypothetical protein
MFANVNLCQKIRKLWAFSYIIFLCENLYRRKIMKKNEILTKSMIIKFISAILWLTGIVVTIVLVILAIVKGWELGIALAVGVGFTVISLALAVVAGILDVKQMK